MSSDETPNRPMRAIGAAITNEKNALLVVIVTILMGALGVMSGVVWNSLSNTVAGHGVSLEAAAQRVASQQAQIAVLEIQQTAMAHTLDRVEQLLTVLTTQRASAATHQ